MRRAVIIIAVIAVVVSLTGAGLLFAQPDAPAPPEAEGLAARYGRITRDLQSESEALRAEAAAASTSGTQSAAVMQLYGDLLLVTDRAGDAYADLDVPSSMRGARHRLVVSLEERTAVIDRLMVAVRASDQKAANGAATDLVETAQTFASAQNEMLRLIRECGKDCE